MNLFWAGFGSGFTYNLAVGRAASHWNVELLQNSAVIVTIAYGDSFVFRYNLSLGIGGQSGLGLEVSVASRQPLSQPIKSY